MTFDTAIIIQGRMGSQRLPGKILMEVNGRPFLDYQLERLRPTGLPIVIATTTSPEDDRIVSFCSQREIPFYRGSEQNVLERFAECARHFSVKTIIRITSDCPLIDPAVVMSGLDIFKKQENEWTFVSNTLDRTYPRGFDFEICSFAALDDAYLNAHTEFDKEHVMPYIWGNRSGLVHILQVKRTEDASKYRLTLDTEEDRVLLSKLITDFNAHELRGEEIIGIMQRHPDLHLINAHINQKTS